MGFPPLYNEAVGISTALTNPSIDDVMKLVLPYIRFSDLLHCARVRRSWYRPCIISLWSNPSTQLSYHISPMSLAVRFIDMILFPRVKDHLVTLDWSDLISFVKENNEEFRVRDDLNLNTVACRYQYAPNVQFEILDGIDGLCDPGLFEESRRYSAHSPQGLLLFSAARCYGLNCPSLLLCSHMENLLFLDMSLTRPDELLYGRFKQLNLPNLRVLKLRSLRLTDWMLKIMLKEHTKLWSLDLRDNLFTDMIAESISHLLGRRVKQHYQSLDRAQTLDLYEYPPLYQRHEVEEVRDARPPTMRPDSKISFMKYIQQNGEKNPVGQFILDRHDPLLKETGLTHLYLSGNKLTSSGILTIMRYTDRLQLFDVGSVRCAAHKPALTPPLASYSLADVRSYISRKLGNHLTELRVHHSIVTLAPTFAYINSDTSMPSLLELSEYIAEVSWRTGYYDPFTIVSNFAIKTLILLEIPRKSFGHIVNEIKTLLLRYRCQEIIIAQAQKDQGYHHRAPPLLSGLRTLRLEFASPEFDALINHSISGDPDAANLSNASSRDFSFFSNPFTTSSRSRNKVKNRRRQSDFSFFTEQEAPSSSSSNQSSGQNSPAEPPFEKPPSTYLSLIKLPALPSMKTKSTGREPKFPPSVTGVISDSNDMYELAVRFVALVTPDIGSSPVYFKSPSSDQLSPYFSPHPNSIQPGPASLCPPPLIAPTTVSSLPSASTQIPSQSTLSSTPVYSDSLTPAALNSDSACSGLPSYLPSPTAAIPEDNHKDTKGKAKEAEPVLYDVIEEIKKFRRECTADLKWTGKLELVYTAKSN